jgi:signal transduction histidine kinase
VAGEPFAPSIPPWTRLGTGALQTRSLVSESEITGRLPEAPRGYWAFAAPIFRDGILVGAFSVSYPLENLGIVLRLHRKIIFTFAFLDGLFIVLFGGWLIGRVAVRPMVRISQGAQAIAAGDYSVRVRIQGPREVEALAASFNEMADRIQEEVHKQEKNLAALERANRELKDAQREMVRVEKMASVGQLAAGIAHEIGNPLAAVLGYTAILQRETNEPEASQHLGHIERETARIQRIIRGLLEFSRPKDAQLQILDINDLIRETVDLVTPQRIFRQVRVKMELSDERSIVSGDRHQLQQALVNILLNAAQAMKGDGILHLATESRVLTPGEGGIPRRRATDDQNEDYADVRRTFPELPGLKEGERVVVLTVRDSGPGIPVDVLERIFDPFFTTKGTGEGTGLGLSIAYGIIEALGGRLWAKNHTDGGAQFTMMLPGAGL